jgi:hypothetical protein
MTSFCVGTVGFPHDPGLSGPEGVFHAVETEQDFDGTALCGARVQAWASIPFPAPGASNECEICRYAVDHES